MEWLEVRVTVASDLVEGVSQVLLDAGSNGVEIKSSTAGGAEEMAPGEQQVLAYYPRDHPGWGRSRERIREGLERVERAFPGQSCRLATRSTSEEDWSHQWRRFFTVQHPLSWLVIKPTWEAYSPASGEVVLEMDPGMAFGTGTHPTTLLSLQLLQECLQEGDAVVDVGTGSGILALAAVHMGARRVTARDNDPVALRVARENATRNGMEDLVSVEHGDLLRGVKQGVNLVIANISRAACHDLLTQAPPILVSDGRLVCSGILNRHRRELQRAAGGSGLVLEGVRVAPPWVALAFRKAAVRTGVDKNGS